jgi:hypothetical protein
MGISSSQVLKALEVISWIIFLGLCVDAGGTIFNAAYIHFLNPEAAKTSWQGVDFFDLYNYDKGQFMVIVLLMSIVLILKTIMFYLIVKIFIDKTLSLTQPFNHEIRKFISMLAYLAIAIGFFSNYGLDYSTWLEGKGILMPDKTKLPFSGPDVWFFMSVILFVISHIFKRGIELQEESELTI